MFKKKQHKPIEEVDYDDMTDEEFFKLMYKKNGSIPSTSRLSCWLWWASA